MTYSGGKNGAGVYQTIINELPPHERYIELFLGSGAILRNKKPAKQNVGIERNQKVVDKFWKDSNNVFCCDAIKYLRNIASSLTKKDLVYADPPYPLFCRVGLNTRYYDYELTDQQHIEFLTEAKKLPCMVCISSYPNSLYDEHLKGWRTVDFETTTHGGKKATERLYINYPKPLKLHDYSHLGKDRTDRQRIKAKIQRHIEGLLKLPALERQAILDAINERM